MKIYAKFAPILFLFYLFNLIELFVTRKSAEMSCIRKTPFALQVPATAGKRITLVFGKMNIIFHEESFILAEKTQSAGIANSLTGDTLLASRIAARIAKFLF